MTKKIAPYFIILLAVCIFFWKIIFQGMVAMPGDLLSGAYYPWLEYKYGYQVGVPAKLSLSTVREVSATVFTSLLPPQ